LFLIQNQKNHQRRLLQEKMEMMEMMEKMEMMEMMEKMAVESLP